MQHFKLLCMSPLLPIVTICTAVTKFFDISLVVQLLIYTVKNAFSYSRIKTINVFKMYYITKSTIITSPIRFNKGLTNVDTRLKQLCINVVSTLFQSWALTLYQRCATLKIRRRILFHFQRQINVISTLIHNIETKMIRR